MPHPDGRRIVYPAKDAHELAILLRTSRDLDIVGDVTATVGGPSDLLAWAMVLSSSTINIRYIRSHPLRSSLYPPSPLSRKPSYSFNIVTFAYRIFSKTGLTNPRRRVITVPTYRVGSCISEMRRSHDPHSCSPDRTMLTPFPFIPHNNI